MVWTKPHLRNAFKFRPEIFFFPPPLLMQGRSKAVSVPKRIWLESPAETQETLKLSADVPEPATDPG